MKKLILGLFFTFAFSTNLFAAINLKLAKTSGSSSFLAIGHPSAIRIEGKGEAPEGELTVTEQGANLLLSGELKLNLKSYDTGIGLRDKHMKEKYLEVDKFETAILKVEQLKIDKTILSQETETKIGFSGTLVLHGISKAVHGDIFVKKVNSQIQISSNFQIKLSDFNITVPSFAGIKVADSVEIKTLNQIDQL
jgi:polyisoprenoid-binding protein YceI